MDTKTRILDASLNLFNAEGEESQSALDIANALNISPGNLYYHFKGKDAIIRVLFDQHAHELRSIISSANPNIKTREDAYIYTCILMEEMWDFRFFYRNLAALLQRYTDLSRQFRDIQEAISTANITLITKLMRSSAPAYEPAALEQIAETMAYVQIFWIQKAAITGQDEVAPPRDLIQHTALSLFSMVEPYIVPPPRS